jgi:hypothetical protein
MTPIQKRCSPKYHEGTSLIEIIVAVLVICVGVTVLTLWALGVWSKTNGMEAITKLKNLQFATEAMYRDGVSAGDTNRVWPGDGDARFSTWANQLVPDYLTTNQFCEFLSIRGMEVSRGRIPQMKDTWVRVYAVSSNSPSDTVFLSSFNFTNTPLGGKPLDPKIKPFSDRGFAVFRKGGDGGFFRDHEVGKTNVIGAFAPMVSE